MTGSRDEIAGTEALLAVSDLTVEYVQGRTRTRAVDSVSFELHSGQTLALVGESGSGKSTIAHVVINLLHSDAQIVGGSIRFEGDELVGLPERSWRKLRGGSIGLVPQDPLVSLNPVRRVGDQVAEVLTIHGIAKGKAARRRGTELLELTGIADAPLRARQYPAQFSGGMRQRVLIAIALAGNPRLIIADEPTSSLDVTVQKKILDHLEHLARSTGAALLLVTHDLGVAADRADRVVVLSQGRVVESGDALATISQPKHEYTRLLTAAAPSLNSPVLARSAEVAAPNSTGPLLSVREVVKEFTLPRSAGRKSKFRAVDAVSFDVGSRETVAIVGESGSGKSTTARIILGLQAVTSGSVYFDGVDYTRATRSVLRTVRRSLTLVYQSPYASLDPRFSVRDLIEEPLANFRMYTRSDRRRRTAELLDQVALPQSYLGRRPVELSGGQRQRIAIARALAVEPRLIVLDEPVSALDVSVQAQILDLLIAVQNELGVSYVFISHDLAVVRQIAHRVVVLEAGRLVETGPTGTVLTAPASTYTQELIAAIPGSRLSQNTEQVPS